MSEPVAVVRRRGSVGDLHALTMPEMLAPGRRAASGVVVWWFDVAAPAVVVGGGRAIDLLDLDACRREGLDVARRGSGGGPVLLDPGASLWVDVVIPADDHRFVDDVVESMRGVGDRWLETVSAVMPGGRFAVHRGPQVHTDWSPYSCFAGLGSGEVLCDGLKLVGISQRRTRDGARYQCLLHRRFDVDRMRRVLRSPPAGDHPAIACLGDGRDDDTDDAAVDEALVVGLAAALGRWPSRPSTDG